MQLARVPWRQHCRQKVDSPLTAVGPKWIEFSHSTLRTSGNRICYVNRLVVISGCSSGGKSTLLAELGRRGYAVVEEPGRRIVKDELAGDGLALPWLDATAFLRRAVTVALADWTTAIASDSWVFLPQQAFST